MKTSAHITFGIATTGTTQAFETFTALSIEDGVEEAISRCEVDETLDLLVYKADGDIAEIIEITATSHGTHSNWSPRDLGYGATYDTAKAAWDDTEVKPTDETRDGADVYRCTLSGFEFELLIDSDMTGEQGELDFALDSDAQYYLNDHIENGNAWGFLVEAIAWAR